MQPWAVLLPVLAIGLLTVGTNLITDGIARAAIGIDRKEALMSATAVDVRDLRVELVGRDADVVDEISLAIAPGEVLGLVGESGLGQDDRRAWRCSGTSAAAAASAPARW